MEGPVTEANGQVVAMASQADSNGSTADVSALFARLGMERRTQAAAYAVRVFSEHDGGRPAD